MTKKQKKSLKKIVIAFSFFAVLFITNLILKHPFGSRFEFGLASVIEYKNLGFLLPFVLYFSVYVYVGNGVLKKCFKNLLKGRVFDENFLMALATVSAFILGIVNALKGGEPEGFDEACAVLLFYQVGEWFQGYAVSNSRKSITSLMNLRPDYANILVDGVLKRVAPETVKVGDEITVLPSEKIPLDGVIICGDTSLDTKALTGESVPKDVFEGDTVLSGYVNLTKQITVRVEKEFSNSTATLVLDLIENASNKKSKTEGFITVFSKYYTPIVVISAFLLALIPSVITKDISTWVYRALNFLVVSCPCALVVSVPLAFFTGIGVSSKNGVLVKGSNYLELLAKSNVFVFDKTGTLTKGNFTVQKVTPEENREEILYLLASGEQYSSHPIAKSILTASNGKYDKDYTVENVAGKGIIAKKGETVLYIGNEKLMQDNGIIYEKENGVGTVVYLAKNGKFVGSTLIADEIKPETPLVINELKKQNAKTVMLTGDSKTIAEDVAKKVGLDEYSYELLPQNKLEKLDKMLTSKGKNQVISFVGDGINDAPSLRLSDVGISMGGLGADAAIEASDVVLMKDDLRSLLKAKKIARATLKISMQNVIFALIIKVLIMVLSSLGITNMWFAVFGDVGVAVICIFNSMRLSLKFKK